MLQKLYNFDNLKSTELPCPAVVGRAEGEGKRMNARAAEEDGEPKRIVEGGRQEGGVKNSRVYY